jgi:hypothetical protein
MAHQNIATRTYERAKPIIEKGDDKLKDSVITGRQSISSAYNEIKKQEKIQQLIEEAKKRLAGNNNKFPDGIKLILGDMRSQEVNEQIAGPLAEMDFRIKHLTKNVTT